VSSLQVILRRVLNARRRRIGAPLVAPGPMQVVLVMCGLCYGWVTIGRECFDVMPAEPRCTCRARWYDCDRGDNRAWPMGLLGEPLTRPLRIALPS
jgi:hypothetical protein